MAQAFSSAGGSGVLLFDEDFDLPPRPPEPEVIEPVFTAAELLAAREQAAQDGRDRAIAEVDGTARIASSRALTEIAVQITAARDEAAAIAEQSAEAIARLLLDCFAAAFPALSARHGAGELAAVLREILPALHREPKITVRINPLLVPAMTEELRSLDTDLAARVRLIPAEGMAMGDVRVIWENGAATRDATSLWHQIESVLAPAGLLNLEPTAKEHELGE
jgi:flagellar biosynthesis/type III secretory pathway protein FliH